MLISEFIDMTNGLKDNTIIKMARVRYNDPKETYENSSYVEYYKDPCYHGVLEINESLKDPEVTLGDIRGGSYEDGDMLISENNSSPSGFLVGHGAIIFYV
jgi:hypothetical protein